MGPISEFSKGHIYQTPYGSPPLAPGQHRRPPLMKSVQLFAVCCYNNLFLHLMTEDLCLLLRSLKVYLQLTASLEQFYDTIPSTALFEISMRNSVVNIS